MKKRFLIPIYVIRFLFAFLFIFAAIEKLFLPYDPIKLQQESFEATGNDAYFNYYNMLQNSGYLYFVGICQMLCGVLIIFRRTYFFGSLMLLPLILCLLMTHVFFTKNTEYLIFDSTILLLNFFLIFSRSREMFPVIFKKQSSIFWYI